MLSIIFVISTLVFAGLFVLRTMQLKKLKNELYSQESQKEAFSFELDNKIDELNPLLFDPLTGLPNRNAFEQRFTQVMNWSKRFQMKFGVLFLDIDKLSTVNKLGYEVGDKLLRLFPARVQGCVRQIDTLARYAGDKFVLLLPQLSKPETVAYVAQRIQDNVIQPFKIDEHELLINTYMGIAIYPIDGTDVETLVKHAHNAMLQAKELGKNKYQFYSPEIQALGERELTLLNYFKNENIFKDMRIEYNPYIDVETNKVVYVEAIPKLSHPVLGLVTDAEFVRISDKCDRSWQITEYLIRTSFMQFKKWEMQGMKPDKLVISVLLKKIEKADLVPALITLLSEINIEPKQLILQINRENITANIESLENSLSLLDKSGIQVAIAVLVLGHFALQKISHISVNYLKIDAELIKLLMGHQENNFVIDRIIALASDSDSKITVIAEGVETAAEKLRLKELGCEVMSGKLFENLISETDKTMS